MRDEIWKENWAELELERTPWGKTKFVNVIEVKGKYQARLQVPGDGRGGCTKRKQYSLPGLFDTPEEAAVLLAAIKRNMKASTGGKLIAPPKIDKPHKPRARQAVPNVASPVPAQLPQSPVATASAVPMLIPMLHMPFAVALPLPMQPLGDACV